MSWLKLQELVHKTLCDGPIESKFVFPLIREAGTQFYIKGPCCAFWRGVVAGGVIGVVVSVAVVGVLWTVN